MNNTKNTFIILRMFFIFLFLFNVDNSFSMDRTQRNEAVKRPLSEVSLAEDGDEVIAGPNEWEISARRAAESWGVSYEVFRHEAEKFLIAYKTSHPFSSYPASVEDLMILCKPDEKLLAEKLDEFVRAHPDSHDEVSRLYHNIISASEASPRFLVPAQ